MLSSSITLKVADLNDTPLLQTLAHSIWWQTFPEYVPESQIKYMLENFHSAQAVFDSIKSGVVWMLIEHNGQAIGFSAYEIRPAEQDIRLHKLYLEPEFQRQGFGGQVIQHVIDIARSRQIGSVSLTVNRGNKQALLSYQKRGFQLLGNTDKQIGEGFIMNDYLMEYKL